jgi:hypothetical protein
LGTRAELLSLIAAAANWLTSSSRLEYSGELEIVPDNDGDDDNGGGEQ